MRLVLVKLSTMYVFHEQISWHGRELYKSPTALPFQRAASGGGVHGVCLTVTLHSLDRGGLCVAE